VLFEATLLLWYPAICFIGFLFITAMLAKVLSQIVRLPVRQAGVLAFSLGSRNSFVVLPLALALPEPFEIKVLVIVLQSLIELFGMAMFVWFIPKILFKIK
jgi:arsenite transporter